MTGTDGGMWCLLLIAWCIIIAASVLVDLSEMTALGSTTLLTVETLWR
jgi:hypothetical protein